MNKIRILYNILNEDINIADRTLVVWGTGNTSLLYYEGLKRLEREGFVVSFYTSSNIEKEKPQELFNGKHVIAPDQIGSLDNPLVLIATPNKRYIDKICAKCNKLGVEARHIDEVLFKLHSNEIKDCIDLFDDDRSKIIETGKGRQVNIYAIDDVVNEPYSFLKADIESYEYQMLCGARKSIQNCHPNLAICIYHNAVDFYQIPLLIHELYPDYRMIVRHHSFTVAETIVYAWKE